MLQLGLDAEFLPPALDQLLGGLAHRIGRSLEEDLERNAFPLPHAVAIGIHDPGIVENLFGEIQVLNQTFVVVGRCLGRWSRPDVAGRTPGLLAVTGSDQGVAVDCQ